MRICKIILSVVLSAVALVLLGASILVLLNVVPGKRAEPAVLQTDAIFAEEPEISLPEQVVAVPAEPETPVEEEIPAPEEVPAEQEEPAEEAETDVVSRLLQSMTPEEMVWQLVLTTPESITGVGVATRAGETTRTALADCPVGGLCYFSANLEDRAQVQTMLTQVQSYVKIPLFLAVDEEGGAVSRVGSNAAMGITWFDPAAEYGSRGDMEEVCRIGQTMADELLDLGFNLNFAPVADVVTNPNNTEIGSRSYSSDPQVAAAMVEAMVQGLQSHHMMACLKHFPGHGSTEADSHVGRSVSVRTLEQLRQTEWVPFRAGVEAGVSFVMLSHLTNENLSALPSSLSPEVVGYLRQELGFTGIIITDSLRMGAITELYSPAEAAVKGLQAGADMLLIPADPMSAVQGILAALESGDLTQGRVEESVLRILKAKEAFGLLSSVQ